MKDTIETILETNTPQQSEADRARLFARVLAGVGTPSTVVSSVPSPYSFMMLVRSHSMTYVALLLMVLLGAGGTVAASESAKPGDLLFPVDRATEQLRLTLAGDETRAALEARFLDERFAELAEMLDEEVVASTSDDTKVVTESGEGRIVGAVAVLLGQADRLGDAETIERLRTLLADIESITVAGRDEQVPASPRIKIDDDRMEVRTDNERIRIEEKDGELRVRYDDMDDDIRNDDMNGRGGDDDQDDRLPAYSEIRSVEDESVHDDREDRADNSDDQMMPRVEQEIELENEDEDNDEDKGENEGEEEENEQELDDREDEDENEPEDGEDE